MRLAHISDLASTVAVAISTRKLKTLAAWLTNLVLVVIDPSNEMNFLWGLLSYVVAFFVVQIVRVPVALALGILAPFARLVRSLAPVFSFRVCVCGAYLGVVAYSALAVRTGMRSSIAMILLPAFITYFTDTVRLGVVRCDGNPAKALMDRYGVPLGVERQERVRDEQAHRYGNLLGFAIGIWCHFRSHSFF